MTEIDLGPITVALVQLPSAGPASAPARAPVYDVYTDESAAAVRGLSKPLLPGGLAFLDATLFRSPLKMAVWTYADAESGRSVTLAQTDLGELKPGSAGKPVIYVPGQALHEAKISGESAVRVVISDDPSWRGARTTFVWLKDGAVLQASARGLTDGELASTADSI